MTDKPTDILLDLSKAGESPEYDIHVLPLATEIMALKWDLASPLIFNYDGLQALPSSSPLSVAIAHETPLQHAIENLIRTIGNDESLDSRSYTHQADTILAHLNQLKAATGLVEQPSQDSLDYDLPLQYAADLLNPQADAGQPVKIFHQSFYEISKEGILGDEHNELTSPGDPHSPQASPPLTEAISVDSVFQLYVGHYTEGIVHS